MRARKGCAGGNPTAGGCQGRGAGGGWASHWTGRAWPAIVAPGSIDVNVYALNDQPGVIPGAGTISVPRIAEWWKQ